MFHVYYRDILGISSQKYVPEVFFSLLFSGFFSNDATVEEKAITTKTGDSFSPLDSIFSSNLDENYLPNLVTSSILCNNLAHLFAEPNKCVCVWFIARVSVMLS